MPICLLTTRPKSFSRSQFRVRTAHEHLPCSFFAIRSSEASLIFNSNLLSKSAKSSTSMTSSSLIPCYVSKKQHVREQSALFFGIVSREEFLASLSCVLWLSSLFNKNFLSFSSIGTIHARYQPNL